DVVAPRDDFADEALARGEVEHSAGAGDVVLQQHEPPRPVEQPQRERALLARDLVVIELRRINGARSELVVCREGFEDRCQENCTHSGMFGHDRPGRVAMTEVLQTAGFPSPDTISYPMRSLTPLHDVESLDAAIEESRERPVLLFKHSRHCGTS